MSVHTLAVYPEVKRLLGIPEDEPIFILRAQDMLAVPAIESYARSFSARARTMGCTKTEIDKFISDIGEALSAFEEWQKSNTGSVKLPD